MSSASGVFLPPRGMSGEQAASSGGNGGSHRPHDGHPDPSSRKEKGVGRSNFSRSSTKFRRLARTYIINRLRRQGFGEIAERYTSSECDEEEDDETHQALHRLAHGLAEEKRHQFEDILERLEINRDNLEGTYRDIVAEMFKDQIHWGRIIAFLVFSGSLAVYCAQNDMEDRIGDVIEWAEADVQTTVSSWVLSQGGWAAFMEHFDDTWTVEVSPYLMVAVAAAVLAGGLFLLRKML